MVKAAFTAKENTERPIRNIRLVERLINRAYIPSFLLALAFNLNSLVDSLLAGVFFSPVHIAAVGIALPIHALFGALLQVVVQGTYVNYTAALGRGQRRKSVEIFTAGLVYLAVIGSVFSFIAVRAAPLLVRIGGAGDTELAELSIQYLRFTAPAYVMTAVTKLITLILGVYGFKNDNLQANIVGIVCNVCFSVLLIKLMPQVGIGALGLGTLIATVPTALLCYASARRHGLPVKFALRFAAFAPKRFKAMASSGFGGPLNDIIDGLAAVLINRMITASELGIEGLVIYSVVCSVWKLVHVSAEGMDYAFAPLVNIFYACHDRNGMKKTFYVAAYQGIADIILWALVIIAASPVLLRLYLGLNGGGAEMLETAREGVVITLCFAPIVMLSYLLVCFFDYTEQMDKSLRIAVIPDSVIFPVLLAILIPSAGYRGIWICLGGNTLIWLVLAYMVRAVRSCRLPKPEELLCPDRSGQTNYPELNIAIRSTDSEVSDLSEKVQNFLREQDADSKTAYLTALCIDELATDVIRHMSGESGSYDAGRLLIEITVIAEEEQIQVLMTNMARPYNPLDFDYTNSDFSKIGLMMVQKIASKIDYNYIYNMNMITIRTEK